MSPSFLYQLLPWPPNYGKEWIMKSMKSIYYFYEFLMDEENYFYLTFLFGKVESFLTVWKRTIEKCIKENNNYKFNILIYLLYEFKHSRFE